MRTHILSALLTLSAVTGASGAMAQTPPPPPPAAPGPAAPPPAAPPAAAPAAPEAAPPAAAPAPAAAAPAAAPPATPAAAPGNWYDKFAVDAFVDAYATINGNGPKPQQPVPITGGPGGNSFRAFDVAEGFALNWIGVNASYTADKIGGTIGLRVGPGASIYNNPADNAVGLNIVKQAYATWKPVDKLTLDLGKWDQPFGSEVADSQMNMNYSRTFLFWYMQPLFFSGLRVDYAASDAFDIKVFAANGWNETLDINRGKTFGGQIFLKPADQAMFYIGYVGGPENADTAITANGPVDVPDANDHWRHMVDFVADISPIPALRFLLNLDYRTESNLPGHTESVYGGNLVIRYNFTDAFNAALRGEWYHDEHADTLGIAGGPSTDLEDGTLTLTYGIGTHLAFMLDNRLDVANQSIFQKGTTETSKTQWTTELGVIASTK